jgi:hypothetical protein
MALGFASRTIIARRSLIATLKSACGRQRIRFGRRTAGWNWELKLPRHNDRVVL